MLGVRCGVCPCTVVTAEMLLTWRWALHFLPLQLNSEKLELEKRESEQEGIVSKLQKKVIGFGGVPACCSWSCWLCTATVCLHCAAQLHCCL